MNKRLLNKAAVYILKVVKYSKIINPQPPVFVPDIYSLLINKAIDYLENKQI